MNVKTALCSGSFLFLVCISGHTSSIQDRWNFKVIVDDRDVGTHSFEVNTRDGVQEISSQANFNVKLLFVNVFSYKHKNSEQWQSNCLSRIDSATRMNRKSYAVTGRREADAFVIEGQPKPTALPACVRTFAYWNPSILDASALLNAQTGDLEPVQITLAGQETYVLGDKSITAKRYRISLQAGYIDVWYDTDTYTWLGLETLTADGNLVRYVPLETPLSRA